jgi:hypothetical protein
MPLAIRAATFGDLLSFLSFSLILFFLVLFQLLLLFALGRAATQDLSCHGTHLLSLDRSMFESPGHV